jgi:hypothetical protein
MTGGLNSTWLPQGKEMPVLFLLFFYFIRGSFGGDPADGSLFLFVNKRISLRRLFPLRPIDPEPEKRQRRFVLLQGD